MRTVRILAVGRIKQSAKYLEDGIKLYESRLKHEMKLTWVEIPDQAPTATRTVDQIRAAEGEAILQQCQTQGPVVLLNERGKRWTSEELAAWLYGGNPLDGGPGMGPGDPIIWIIGGAYGTSDAVAQRATLTLSLSPMTFPHQVVRLLLVEQLYRASSIARGTPYHK